ncbi:hypothetical protein AVEN_220972-1 [Araneus ventricosus]|uniref:Uncharacterized protein n=1 Tax=Araneus ventricosus TaxID=182803 RepID=A0A4Y2NHI5_ARAVE|nr:hypothetical protein AVEN_220972-1 [Araneus ventricosus]
MKRPRWPSGKVSTSGPEDSRYETRFPTKISRVWRLLHIKSYVMAKRPFVGVLYTQRHPDSAHPTGFKVNRAGGEENQTPATNAFIKIFQKFYKLHRNTGGD